MPGIGDEIDGPMQQAPQPGRHGRGDGRAFTGCMRFTQDIGCAAPGLECRKAKRSIG